MMALTAVQSLQCLPQGSETNISHVWNGGSYSSSTLALSTRAGSNDCCVTNRRVSRIPLSLSPGDKAVCMLGESCKIEHSDAEESFKSWFWARYQFCY